jgi:hypothetical protein
MLPSEFSFRILNLSAKPVLEFFTVEPQYFNLGTNSLQWPAIDKEGHPVPNGIYIFSYKIKINNQVITKVGKLVLLR